MEFTSDDLLAFLDQKEAEAKGAATEVAEPTPTTPVETQAVEAEPAAPENEAPTEAPNIEPQQFGQADKDANAFAQMRMQNKMYGDLLHKLADASGIQYTDEQSLMDALNGAALN